MKFVVVVVVVANLTCKQAGMHLTSILACIFFFLRLRVFFRPSKGKEGTSIDCIFHEVKFMVACSIQVHPVKKRMNFSGVSNDIPSHAAELHEKETFSTSRG